MDKTKKQDQTSTHKIGIYLWIWGLLFVLSFFSFMLIKLLQVTMMKEKEAGLLQ